MSRSIWDWLVVTVLAGESIAVIGPRSSGKTTLYGYLLETNKTGETEPTLSRERTTWNRQHELGLNIRKGIDVPGGAANYPDWEEQFRKSSKIFYLFDAYALRTQTTYQETVRREGMKLNEWGSDRKHVMMLGTHADEDPQASELGAAAYQDLIAELDVVVAFGTRAKVQGIAVGSMLSSDDAAALVRRALRAP